MRASVGHTHARGSLSRVPRPLDSVGKSSHQFADEETERTKSSRTHDAHCGATPAGVA
jgi:hypothetical protein